MSTPIAEQGVVALTETLGRLLQGVGRTFEFTGGTDHVQTQISQTVTQLRKMTQQVAATKTPFFVVYTLTSVLFNSKNPHHLWCRGVKIRAIGDNESAAAEFRSQSTSIWFQMEQLYQTNGFLP